MTTFQTMTVAEYPAEDLFWDEETGSDSYDWEYCRDRASFQHKDACEFMLYLYKDESEEWFEAEEIKKMRNAHCSQEFIDLVLDARKQGFSWLLLYA